MLRRVALARDTPGKGIDSSREMRKAGALKGLEATTRGLDADEVR
jgi:hypothetical protein